MLEDIETFETESNFKVQSNSFETEIIPEDGILENEIQSSEPEMHNIEDEIEILEVVKESLHKEVFLDQNKSPESCNKLANENDEDDSIDRDPDESVREIDNEWYTFVKDAKTFNYEKEVPLQNRSKSTNKSASYNKERDEVEHYAFVINNKISISETERSMENDENIAKKRPYQCTFCRKAFHNTGNLKIHERIHTGEVPFECKSCKKRFKEKGNLIRHERIHTGEVPYECKTCKKRFNQTSTLKIHERIHTGENPYECKTCNKRFKQQAHLKLHEKQH